MSSFRSLHFAKAASQIRATESIVDLARLEAEELAGGEHRPSLVEDFTQRARTLVLAGVSDDDQFEALAILDGKPKSIILAALEGDSHSDDDTGPGETREGGGSPSVAAGVRQPEPARSAPEHLLERVHRRPVGRVVRQRLPDGRVVVVGLANLRGRRG